MATILGRGHWTDTPKGFTRISSRRLAPADVELLVPHYPAAGDVTYGPEPSRALSAAALRGWRNLHVTVNRWADIGYAYGIDQAGRIWELAGDTHAGAHAVGWNFRAIGCLFIVGDNERPSAKARAAYRALGRRLQAEKFPNLAVVPIDHGRLSGNSTACAGQPIRSDIDAGNLTFGGSRSSTTASAGGQHTVSPGDTLTAIASAHGTSVAALQSANGISDANLIRVGQQLDIPTGGSGDSGSAAASNLARSRSMTSWPQSALPVRDFPQGTYWLRLDDDSRAPIVPDEYRHALVVALGEAGHDYRQRTAQGAWDQIRRWLREQHGYNTATDRRSVARDWQRYLRDQGVYRGAIDGYLGPQSIWAATTWLNRIRTAYL